MKTISYECPVCSLSHVDGSLQFHSSHVFAGCMFTEFWVRKLFGKNGYRDGILSYCSLSATKLSASTIGHMSGVQCYMSVSGGGEAVGLGGEVFGTGEGARENRRTGG